MASSPPSPVPLAENSPLAVVTPPPFVEASSPPLEEVPPPPPVEAAPPVPADEDVPHPPVEVDPPQAERVGWWEWLDNWQPNQDSCFVRGLRLMRMGGLREIIRPGIHVIRR